MAEAWLMAQEPYLLSRNYGRNLEEVIALIKKHEAFEKSAATQDERFLALEKLTNYELKEMQKRGKLAGKCSSSFFLISKNILLAERQAEEERRRRAGGTPPRPRPGGETVFPATSSSSFGAGGGPIPEVYSGAGPSASRSHEGALHSV